MAEYTSVDEESWGSAPSIDRTSLIRVVGSNGGGA